ncbi:MAG: ABC transporter permease [Streptosporangiaceae bacterium]
MSTAVRAEQAAPATLRAGSARLRDAIRAEWTKVRTVAGPSWLLLAIVVLTVAVSTAAVGATSCPRGVACPVDTTKLSLTGIEFGQAVVAILAVQAVSNEYSTGMIRVTLAALPGRDAVLAAKAVIIGALVLLAGAVAVLGSVLAGALILPGHGFTPAHGFRAVSLGYGPTLRAAAGSVLYLALVALLGVGVAAVIRDSAVTVGVVLALLYLFPIVIAFIGNPTWQRRVERYSPVAGLNIQATTGLKSLAITPWAGLGVMSAWAGVALLTGGLALRLRDA